MTDQELLNMAESARAFAHAPYSHYTVGAALLCEDGTVYTGCNIENASFGATNCAERTALFKAVSEGHRDFVRIAICGGKAGTREPCPPCGVCRQVLSEFCGPDFTILLTDKTTTLGDLLPLAFTLED